MIEERNESVQSRIAKAIKRTKTEAQEKYNMTDNDFNTFVTKAAEAMKGEDELELRICSCLACVYRVMDARGKFGEHERCVRVARGDSRVQL